MTNFNNHIKILNTISLASSNAREDTLTSIVFNTIEKENNSVDKKSLKTLINETFDFKPFESELQNLITKLIEEDKLIEKGEAFSLSDDQIEKLNRQKISLTDNEKERFQNFKNFILDDLEFQLEIGQIKILWSNFLDYLYSCFFEFGQDALKTLHPNMEFNGNSDFESIETNFVLKLKKDSKNLAEIFQLIIEKFAEFASESDLNFLVELAQKTSSFTSLGVNPDLIETELDSELIDWTLYLDTNILYSLLNLHYHRENETCKALVHLINENKDILNINLRYSEFTKRELSKKKSDFKKIDSKISNSTIRALLKTNKLDNFSRSYYEKLLNQPDSTPHPSKIIKIAENELKLSGIKIGRNAKRVEKIGEDIINAEINDFYNYLEKYNDLKEEFSKNKGIEFHRTTKGESQVRHDITLRALLKDSRNLSDGDSLTMNNVKFFGITLDKTLIKYDRTKVKDYADQDKYPIFFSPSFLLDKLTRLLPIQSKNYKKAFIKALTTKGYHKSQNQSDGVLKLANYLKSIGVDNEEVIYNLVTEDLFLKELDNKKDTEYEDFVSSELNRQIESTQQDLKETESNLETTQEQNRKTQKENTKIIKKEKELSRWINTYKSSLKQLNDTNRKLKKQNSNANKPRLDFEEATEKDKITSRNKELKENLILEIENKIENFQDEKIKKWQKDIWWNLIWIIPISIFQVLFYTNNLDKIKLQPDNLKWIADLVSILGFLTYLFIAYLLFQRYFNETNKKSKRENIKIPNDLKKELRDIRNK